MSGIKASRFGAAIDVRVDPAVIIDSLETKFHSTLGA
jgi:hypothetical protein